MNRFSVLIALAFAVSLCFFILCFNISKFIIDRKNSAEIDERIVNDLEDYTQEHPLETGSRKELWRWCSTRGVDIEVFVDGRLSFSSIFDAKKDTYNFEESEKDKTRAHRIRFNDAEADVVFYPYLRFYDQAVVVEAVASILLFFAIIVIWTRREIEYIHLLNEEILVLEGGDLSREITVKGDDEITMLAESVDEFRKSMQNQLKTIERLEKSNRLMAAEIAHDLRTPLTSLIMYLDFTQKEIEGKEPAAEEYLTKAREKSVRLKDLLDQNYNYMTMQDFFLIEKQQVPAFEVLAGYLGDIMTCLESEGFYVRSDISYGHSNILIQREAIGRVFGNLLSNIMKYANREEEVVICCREREKHVEIRVMNKVRIFEGEKPESTGFGSRIIRRLMEEMDGEYSVKETGSDYTTILRFLKA